MPTVRELFCDWYSVPQDVSRILRSAGFPQGIATAGAKDAPAEWVDPEWVEVDVSGVFERPRMRRVRRISITGPSGPVIGRIVD